MLRWLGRYRKFMLKTVREYIMQIPPKSFEEFWVDYLIEVGDTLHTYELKSISSKDLTIKNIQQELHNLGKEMSEW